MKVFNKRGESIEIGDNDIVPDGFGVHCPAFLMDGIQREIATSRARIIDAAGRPAGNRPGFCFATDANDDNERAARIAYDQMVARNQSNWRGPNTAHAISDAATPEASFAAYEKYLKDAWRTPQARDDVTIPGGDDNDVERARAVYKDKLQNAWRTTGGVGFGGSFGG